MSNNRPEEFDPAKRHWELEQSDNGEDVLCTRCRKVLEHREGGLPDYVGFMGSVFIKENLPCLAQPTKASEGQNDAPIPN